MRATMNRREFLTTSAISAGTLAVGGCATNPRRDVLVGSSPGMPSASTAVFELRVYFPGPGKADALNNRFRQHTLSLFTRHHIENVAYWMPVDPADQRLIYLLRYPSREAREASWKAFMGSPTHREFSMRYGPCIGEDGSTSTPTSCIHS